MTNKINKLRNKLNKSHTVFNRNPNFPMIYYCVGEKFAYLFDQEGGYDYNGEVAHYADNYGAKTAIAIERDMQHQDDLMNDGKIPYNPITISDVQLNADIKTRPDDTDIFLFQSKNVPYDFLDGFNSSNMQNVIDDQDSTVSALIRAHDINEAMKIFELFKNYQVDYVDKKGPWTTYQREGYPIKINNL